MKRTTLAFLSGAAALLALSAAVSTSTQQAKAQQGSSEPIYLNQGWSQEDREWYYHFSQGSAVLSYDIYLNLEVAGSQDLLRSERELRPAPWTRRTRTIRMGCRLASAKRRLRPRSKAGQPATMPA